VFAFLIAPRKLRCQTRREETFFEVAWNCGTSCSMWGERMPHHIFIAGSNPAPFPYLREITSCGLYIAVVSVNYVRSTSASGLKTAFTTTQNRKRKSFRKSFLRQSSSAFALAAKYSFAHSRRACSRIPACFSEEIVFSSRSIRSTAIWSICAFSSVLAAR
jgi:predicted metal-binding protein